MAIVSDTMFNTPNLGSGELEVNEILYVIRNLPKYSQTHITEISYFTL